MKIELLEKENMDAPFCSLELSKRELLTIYAALGISRDERRNNFLKEKGFETTGCNFNFYDRIADFIVDSGLKKRRENEICNFER